jgi:hypothetical protein
VEMMDSVKVLRKSVIILGDFNIDLFKCHLAWESTVDLFNLKQLVTEPTRITATSTTLLDHIYCNHPLNIMNVKTISSGMSDHCPISCVWSCKTPSKSKGGHIYVNYRSMKNFDSTAFLFDVSHLNVMDLYQCSNADDALNLWNQKFVPIIDKHAPLKTKRVKNKTYPKWLTQEIIDTMRERDECKKAKRYDEYKQLRNKVSALVKSSKKQYFEDMIKNNNDTSSLWRAMNTISGKKQKRIIPSSSNLSPGTFNKYFVNDVSSIFNSVCKDSEFYYVPTELEDFCKERQQERTCSIPLMAVHEVGAYISKMKNKKSMGPDNISVYFLKLSLPYIIEPLTFIYNLSIAQGVFPSAFKEAKIIPIPKTRAPTEPRDFRPISLLPVASKPLEKHLHKHLCAFLEENCLFYTYQSGFRKYHSCQTALTALCDTWLESINKTHLTGAVFLDFRKAFDLIDHSILLRKIDVYFQNTLVTSLVRSYLSNRTQYVQFNGKSSSKALMKCGVPQGSILGPLFFCLFINDLPISLKDTNVDCDMFADDNTLHSNDKTIDTVQQSLQQGLDIVQDWCQKNKMVLNPEKTKSMVVATRQKHQRQQLVLNLNINSVPVEQVQEHKVLGVILDNELNWHSHINYINKRLSKNLYLLYQLKQYDVGLEARTSFFYAHVQSHVNYASNIWCGASANYVKLMNSLYRRAAKLILPNPLLSTEEKQKELGILSLDKQFFYNTALLMFKVRSNIAPPYLSEFLTPPSSRYGSENYILPLPRVDIFKTSFSFSGPSTWNSLPAYISQCPTLNTFKKCLHKYLLES